MARSSQLSTASSVHVALGLAVISALPHPTRMNNTSRTTVIVLICMRMGIFFSLFKATRVSNSQPVRLVVEPLVVGNSRLFGPEQRGDPWTNSDQTGILAGVSNPPTLRRWRENRILLRQLLDSTRNSPALLANISIVSAQSLAAPSLARGWAQVSQTPQAQDRRRLSLAVIAVGHRSWRRGSLYVAGRCWS